MVEFVNGKQHIVKVGFLNSFKSEPQSCMGADKNLVWSFVYNLVALPLAMSGFVTPWMAGIGMSGSSLLVVLNSLRLQSSSER